MKTKTKYKQLPKSNTEKEMLEQIKRELPSDMDNKLNQQEDNKNENLKS